MTPCPLLHQIGQRLRAHRLRRGLALATLAAQVDLCQQSLSRIERGQVNVPICTLVRLAQVYGIGLAALVASGEGARHAHHGATQAQPPTEPET